MSKLLIIRGPSASGKSTVANELFKKAKRPTLLVSEDTIRKMFSDHQVRGHISSRHLATQAVLTGLQNDYDVIYHGILRVNDGNENRFDEILAVHPTENYFFYLNVSLKETMRRHQSRDKKNHFSVEALQKWWEFSSPTERTDEIIIEESSSIQDTIHTIINVAKVEL